MSLRQKQFVMFRIFVSIMIILTIFSCQKKILNSPPDIGFEIFPYAGDSLTPFHFDLTNTEDNEDVIENLMSRFDWNSDGIWDTEFVKLKPVIQQFNEGGMHYITVEVIDTEGLSSTQIDSLYIFSEPDFGELIDPRDGQKYKTVYLGGRWWMAEHLRFGTQISSDSLPRDNGEFEYYLQNNKEENLSKYGGLYTWEEALDYSNQEGSKGICPNGWHIPSSHEWKSFSQNETRIFLSYNHGPNGPSGLNLQLGGSLLIYFQEGSDIQKGVFMFENEAASFWSSSQGEKKLGIYNEVQIKQNFQIAYSLNPFQNDETNQVAYGFKRLDNLIHAQGDIMYYMERNLVSFQIYAQSVRCIKDL